MAALPRIDSDVMAMGVTGLGMVTRRSLPRPLTPASALIWSTIFDGTSMASASTLTYCTLTFPPNAVICCATASQRSLQLNTRDSVPCPRVALVFVDDCGVDACSQAARTNTSRKTLDKRINNQALLLERILLRTTTTLFFITILSRYRLTLIVIFIFNSVRRRVCGRRGEPVNRITESVQKTGNNAKNLIEKPTKKPYLTSDFHL